jgi:hypothetical protein
MAIMMVSEMSTTHIVRILYVMESRSIETANGASTDEDDINTTVNEYSRE